VFAGGIDEQVRPVLVSADGTVVDGGGYPWAPTLNGGFAVLEVPSREEAVLWAARIAKSCRPLARMRDDRVATAESRTVAGDKSSLRTV
jgi:hypothetical protein